MNNLVKIKYKGRELIGQIELIESVYDTGYTIHNDTVWDILYYVVSLREQNTNLLIKDIIIDNLSKIKLL